MRILSSSALLLPALLLLSSCGREYARFQRTPQISYRQPVAPPTAFPSVAAEAEEDISLPAIPADKPAADPVNRETSEVSAAPQRIPAPSPAQRTRQRIEHITRILSSSESESNTSEAQPRPKKTQEKKTLREILGLKPRPKLNWWQRIPWQIKASVIVIAVALAFAVLKVTIMAIIFGLIGAYLLVRGLKKSFKVRRPIF